MRVESAEKQPVRIAGECGAGDSQEIEAREDTRLLRLIAEGDQRALAGLYQRRGRLLYSLVGRILVNEMETQEVMQDAFIQIWRRAHRYDPERSSPLAWMAMLARGLALDRLRSRSRREVRQAAYERELASLEVEVGARHPNDRDELAAACAAALNRLPEEQGRALQLAFFRGWTHEEIARAVNQPLGTVKSRIRRGLLTLRHVLKDYHG